MPDILIRRVMILIDTNVVSEALKPAPSLHALDWLDRHFDVCAISTITTDQALPGTRRTFPGDARQMAKAPTAQSTIARMKAIS